MSAEGSGPPGNVTGRAAALSGLTTLPTEEIHCIHDTLKVLFRKGKKNKGTELTIECRSLSTLVCYEKFERIETSQLLNVVLLNMIL